MLRFVHTNSFPSTKLAVMKILLLFVALTLNSVPPTEGQGNETCLVFAQLPSQTNEEDDRPLTIVENGLQGWATVPKAFVDATGAKGLPTDLMRMTIPPLINGSGITQDAVLDLFRSHGAWWAPMLVVTLLGALFAIIFGITGFVFCCCRCCNNCGGSKRMDKKNHEGIIKLILGIFLVIFLVLLVAGAIIALVGNEQVNDNVKNFNSEISDSIFEMQQYFNSSVQELRLVVDQASVVVNCSLDLLNSNLTTVGQRLVENVTEDFNNVLATAQNTSQDISHAVGTLNVTIDQVQMLDTQLTALAGSLQMLRGDLTELATACDAGSGDATCEEIRTVRDQLQLSINISEPLNTLVQIRDMTSSLLAQLDAAIATSNETFNSVPLVDGLSENLDSAVQSVVNITKEFQQEVDSLLASILSPFLTALDISTNGSSVGTGAISGAQQTIQSSTGYVQNIQRVIYGFVIVMCCFVLIVAVVIVAALICGIAGYRKDAVPWERSRVSHCGAVMLLIGVGLMFLFGFLLLILTCIVFFFSSLGQKVCYSAGPESNYEIFTEFTDARVWGSNQTLFEFLSSTSGTSVSLSSLTAGGIILDCRANEPLYATFNIDALLSSGGLSLNIIDNLTQIIPSVDVLLGQLPSNVNFNAGDLVSADTSQLLSDLINGSSLQLNVSSVVSQLNQSVTGISVDDLLTDLAQWRAMLPALAANITSVETFINTTVRSQVDSATATQRQIVSLLGDLENLEQSIRASASATVGMIDNVLSSVNQANITEFLMPHVTALRTVLVDYAQQYSDFSRRSITMEVGRCRPLFNTYNNLYVTVCEYTLVGLNAFWWSLGWCVLFFIPIIILSVILARFLARMDGPVGYDDATLGGRTSSFQMDSKKTYYAS